MTRVSTFIITFLLTITLVQSQNVIVNSNCRKAYEDILSLRFNDANAKIAKEKVENPNNTFILYLENYIDFLTVTISEDENIFDCLKNKIELRTSIINELNDSSRYKNYFLGNLSLQWATVNLRFKNYASSALGINKAYRLLKQNNNEFPEFFPNNITLGVLHIMIGIVPDSYNWFLKLISMTGTVQQGKNELKLAYLKCEEEPEFSYLKNEILFYMGMVDLNLSPNPEFANYLISRVNTLENNNLLLTYLAINTAMRNGKNNDAFLLFQTIDSIQNYYPFHYLNHLHGDCFLRKLDSKNARLKFSKFTNDFSGHNYIKDARQKIAWCYLIEGDTNKYKIEMTSVISNGSTNIDADKNANKNALANNIPNIELLKSRLLFDGGYYNMADSILNNINDNLLNAIQIIEKNYRQGRIAHSEKKHEKAKKYYELTIEKGSSFPEYFAANSALKLGNIFEMENNNSNAIKYYNLCLEIDFEEYRNSIRGKAKQGIERIEN